MAGGCGAVKAFLNQPLARPDEKLLEGVRLTPSKMPPEGETSEAISIGRSVEGSPEPSEGWGCEIRRLACAFRRLGV